jgi:hypothetical protein
MKGFFQALCICGVKNQKVTYQVWRRFTIWPFIPTIAFNLNELRVKKTWKKKRDPLANGLSVDEGINLENGVECTQNKRNNHSHK